MNTSIKYLLVLFLALIVSLECFTQSAKMKKPEMRSFLDTHLVYPEKAIEEKKEGIVKILFATDESGMVTKRSIVMSVSSEVDQAALRLFDLILWNPAESYGLPVTGTGDFKIKFNIKKYQNLVKQRGYGKIEPPFTPIDQSIVIYSPKEVDEPPRAVLDSIYQNVQHFLAANLVYPEAAQKVSVSGVVKLKFVIEANGLPSNIEVDIPVGGGCTEEAIVVMQKLKWFPGIKDGKAVRTSYSLNIKFDPAEELRNKHIPNQSNVGI